MSPGLSVAPPVLHAGADSLAGPRWGCRGGRGTGGKSGGGRGLGGCRGGREEGDAAFVHCILQLRVRYSMEGMCGEHFVAKQDTSIISVIFTNLHILTDLIITINLLLSGLCNICAFTV